MSVEGPALGAPEGNEQRTADLCYEATMSRVRATKKVKTTAARRLVKAAEKTGRTKVILERLRKICLALPEANERLSHGEPTWFAGKGKVFAMLDDHHHGADHVSVWVPLPRGAQEDLVASAPDRFFRPPYVGASGWVGVVLDGRPNWSMVEGLIRDAFVHVAPKKLVEQL